jgi:ribosome biogenesis protein BRX1
MAPKRKAAPIESDATKAQKVQELPNEIVGLDAASLPQNQSGYINKQRVLVFASRGITTRYRHLLDDMRKLLPHHKKDVKVN